MSGTLRISATSSVPIIWNTISYDTHNLISNNIIDITKQVQALGTHSYILPNGNNGQFLYFTPDYATSSVQITVTNNRTWAGVFTSTWKPFYPESNDVISIAIFSNGAWNLRGGTVL